MWVRAAMATLAAAGLCSVAAQTPAAKSGAARDRPDCGSLVIVKCERPEADETQRARREAARRIEKRRGGSAVDVMDKVIIEDDAIAARFARSRDQSCAVASSGQARRELVLHRRIGAVHVHEHLPAATVSLLPVHRPCRQPAQHGARLGANALKPTREPFALPRRQSFSRPARARTPAAPAARSAPQPCPSPR